MDGGKTSPHVLLPTYQGPLDLLLTLIQDNKVDIYDIPIAQIADQFIASLTRMESMDLEVTSEFLLLAAQLLYLKSRELLPKPPQDEPETDEEDLRQELVERLLTYRTFKQAAQILETLDNSPGGKSYCREIDIEALLAHSEPANPLQGVSFTELWQAFCQVIERAEKGETLQHVEPDEIAIETMLADVLRRVILHPKGLHFSQLIRSGSRMEIIVSFLAVLELLQSGKVRAEQITVQSEIMIFPTPKAWEFTEEE